MTRSTARIAIPAGLGAFLLASLLACCNRPESPACLRAAGVDTVVTGAFDAPAVRLTIADGVEVVLHADGDSGRVAWRWEGPANLLAHAQTELDAGELVLGDANACDWVRNLGIRLRVEVWAPDLRTVEHTGTGDFRWEIGARDGLWSFDARRSAGRTAISAHVDTLEARLHAGPSHLNLAGSADRLGAYVAGLGTLDASGLRARRAFLNQSSAHELRFHATDYAYLGIHGSGDIRGEAVPLAFDVDRTESGQVIWPE